MPDRALARISEAAIEANCRRLGRDVELCAVVKADGYGHGAVRAARAAGTDWLAVATAGEAPRSARPASAGGSS